MAGRQDFFEIYDDFMGYGNLPVVAAANDCRTAPNSWFLATAGTIGNLTYDYLTNESSGAVRLLCGSTSEAQVLNMYWADTLGLDLRQQLYMECRIKTNQAALNTNSILAVGLASSRHNTIGSIVTSAFFSMAGTDYVATESDDNTANEVAATNTGVTLVNAYKVLKLDATNTSDLKFYVDGQRVNRTTTHSMAGVTSTTRYVQPYIQFQKASSAAADGVTIDYVYISGKRKF